tara:strand:- start:3368 stop:4531 length:1164 start_codon:yes stop_codon:yes gene_type:complete
MRVLIVEDSKSEALLIETLFRDSGEFTGKLVHVTGMQDARDHLDSGRYDIAFVDHILGSEKGTSLIRRAGGRRSPTPMVLITGVGSAEIEAEALDAGAMDYIDKNHLSGELLHRTMKFVLKNHEQTLQARSNELYHRERALEARISNDEKSNFLANMSHELRTPLNAIMGFSEAIQSEIFGAVEGPGATRYSDYVDDIHRSSQHLLKLIDDLLDLSRIGSGGFEIELSETSLNDVIDDVILMTVMQASEKDIGLEFDIPETLPAFSADTRLLAQVLINLVANAIAHSPPGRRINVSAVLENRNLVIAVCDNGSGISDAEISRLSGPYFPPVGGPGNRDTKAGLGLSISKSIMETHLGGLSVDRRVNGGTKAKIWLPINLEMLNKRPS